MSKSIICFLLLLNLFEPRFAEPQEPKIPRVGFLGVNDPISTKEFIDAFRQGLRELGYIEQENILIQYRWADGKPENLATLAAELVSLNLDVIFAAAAPSVTAAKNATKKTPIIFEMLADPVSAGFVNSLAKPGANLTGIAGLAPELSGKRLQLLKEIIPRLTSVALLANPANPNFRSVLRESEIAASGLKLQLHVIEVREPVALNAAFGKIARDRVDALSVIPDSMFFAQRKAIGNLAVQGRLPSVFGMSGVAEIGGLMSYSPNQREMWRRAATYVDKVLKGAKPGDLPVEQPTKFELVINLNTAKQIAVTIPPNVLARADKVIK
jgi:putative ABC transport system substrate-binding protein